MSNAFATRQFLNFASLSSSNAGTGKLFLIDDEPRFPYYEVIKKDQDIILNFVVTPICFSGPHKINFENFFAAIGSEDNFFVGGFLQTRCTSVPSENFHTFGDYHAYFDDRINFRISLSLDDKDYISSLRRNSRYAVRKILNFEKDYSLATFRGDLRELEQFSKLYDATATRVGFKTKYQFTFSQWRGLLESDSWNLYLLYFRSNLIGGAVIASVETGYDYTFIANDPNVTDSSRALLYFVRRELASHSNKVLDIGGGINEDDYLAHYKRSMGGEPVQFLRCKFGRQSLFRDTTHAQDLLSSHWP